MTDVEDNANAGDNTAGVAVDQAEHAVIVRWDDGAVNAIGHKTLEALTAALDQAVDAGKPLVILGRERLLTGGFDLKVFAAGPEPTSALVGAGADFLHRLVAAPVPIIVGAPGHAVAMGSLILMAADIRVGIEGAFKVGLNEVAIGMTLPHFAVTLAQHRLSKRHLLRATSFAQIYTPAEAVDVGYFDEIVAVEDLEATVLGHAEIASGLSATAFGGTKPRVRASLAQELAAAIQTDKDEMSAALNG